MARIRTVKPEFWGSPDVAAMSVISRLIFIGLWNLAEDNGVGLAHDRWVASQLFPMDDPVQAVENVRRAFGELSRGGQLDLFEVDGRRLYRVTGWKHQKIDKPNPKPRYKLPEEYGDDAVTCSDTPFGDDSANVRGAVAEPSRPRARPKDQVPDQGKESAPTELALVPRADPPPQSRTIGRRAQDLARAYVDVVPLSKFPAILGFAKKALEAGYEDEKVRSALLRLAEQKLVVTTDSLRIELDGRGRRGRPRESDLAAGALAHYIPEPAERTGTDG